MKLKHFKNINNLKLNEKGQALLFVVIAMTIALALGINASVRTISSLSRTTRTDTASRALAAAEGGIERFLALSTNQLEAAVKEISGEGGGSCPVGTVFDSTSGTSYCRVDFDAGDGGLVSQAFVTVERYAPEFYPFELEEGQIKEVNLYDFVATSFYGDPEVTICWTSETGAALTYLTYNIDGIQEHGGIEDTTNLPSVTGYNSDGFSVAGGGSSDGLYEACEVVSIGDDIYGLRIRSLGGSASVGIYGDVDDLPLQGYRITSVGRLQQDSGVTASRTIKVVRTLPYLPGAFDYALYTSGSIIK